MTDAKTAAVRDWLIHGGGGHEDGEDGLRTLTVSGEGLVEFLAAWAADHDAALAEAVREKLRPYLNHRGSCPVHYGAPTAKFVCNCGLDEAFTTDKAHTLKRDERIRLKAMIEENNRHEHESAYEGSHAHIERRCSTCQRRAILEAALERMK